MHNKVTEVLGAAMVFYLHVDCPTKWGRIGTEWMVGKNGQPMASTLPIVNTFPDPTSKDNLYADLTTWHSRTELDWILPKNIMHQCSRKIHHQIQNE
jgi:hypothetical protein